MQASRLGDRNYRRRLFRIRALMVATVYRRRHIKIGQARGNAGIDVRRSTGETDLRVWTAGGTSTVQVVADNVRRGARGPGQGHVV